MRKCKKIGVILILIGLCLPTVTLPFISEFYPLPNVCLTSNFFRNMGNMEIVLRPKQRTNSKDIPTIPSVLSPTEKKLEEIPYKPKIAIPYRYIFALGAILVFTGIGAIVLSRDEKRVGNQ